MSCVCGDSQCPSCGAAQGTLDPTCAECMQGGVELTPCTYGCGETLCVDCLGEHERECEDSKE